MINVRNLFYHNALVAFDVHTPEAMSALGLAFGKLLERDWSDTANVQRIERIGLVADIYTGKSVFVNGLTRGFKNAVMLEDKKWDINTEKPYPQALWHTLEAGFIRHVDAGFFKKDPARVLDAYRAEFLENNNLGGIDIIENADCGVLTSQFDAAFKFDKFRGNDQNPFRKVYFYATREFQDKPGFTKFLNAAYRINRPEAPPEIT